MTSSHTLETVEEPQRPQKKAELATFRSGANVAAFIPTNVTESLQLADLLSRSTIVPDQFRGDPGAVFATIASGAERGLTPMMALQNTAVINGRACIWGDAIPALVLRAGHSLTEWVEGEGDNMVAYCRLTRGDTGQVTERSFSVNEAAAAGLLNKSGPWKQYRKRMLSMRARGWATRDGAADALLGMSIAEEVGDFAGPDRAKDITPSAPPAANAHIMAALADDDDGTDAVAERQCREEAAERARADLEADAAFLRGDDAAPMTAAEMDAETSRQDQDG